MMVNRKQGIFIRKDRDEVIICIRGYENVSVNNAAALLINISSQYPESHTPITEQGFIFQLYQEEEMGDKTLDDLMLEIDEQMSKEKKYAKPPRLSDKWFKNKFSEQFKKLFPTKKKNGER